MNIQAVVFDAVGTLISPSPGMADIYQSAIARHCGLQLEIDRIGVVVSRALSQRSAQPDLTTDETQEQHFWMQVVTELCGEHPARQSCYEDLYRHFQHPQSWQCFDDVADCLKGLHTANLTVAIASNFDRRLHAVLDGLDSLSGITHRFVSSEIGWRKPALPFFEHVCRKLRMKPDNILFVGDDLENDVMGANKAGCRAALIQRDPAAESPLPDNAVSVTALTDILALLSQKSPL